MSVFTLDDFRAVMREAAGELEVGSADVAGTSYVDLGYDSLALLEIAARIKQILSIQVPDDAVAPTATPAETVAAVNLLLAVPVGVA
jgi:act minimal PKS acyl carrier protein